MAESKIPMEIHEIKCLSVEKQKSNSNTETLIAVVPSGYKFLCWLSFGCNGAVDFVNSANTLSDVTVRVWTGQTNSTTVKGTYLVYR